MKSKMKSLYLSHQLSNIKGNTDEPSVISSEGGFSMIIAIMSVLLLFTTVLGVTSLVITQRQITRSQRQSGKALSIAEAGINHALFNIRTNSEPTSAFPLSVDYGGGNYLVNISQPATTSFSDWYHLTAVGSINDEASRTIELDAFKVSFWNMGYSGSTIDTLQGNAEIIGSLYVRSDLTLDAGGSGIKRGPLYVKGDILLDNAAAQIGEPSLDVPLFLEGDYGGSGDYYVNPVNNWVPKINLPSVDMAYLEQQAIANNNTVYNGNVNLRNSPVSFGNFNYTLGGSLELRRTITTSGFGNLSLPVAASIDSVNNLYVLERSQNRVLKYSNASTYVDSWDGLNTPNDLAVDTRNWNLTLDQYVYVSDTNDNDIKKYDADGTLLQTISAGPLSIPLGITVDAGGNLYVVDSGNSMIRKYDNTGTLVLSINVAGADPRDVAVDSSGNIYITCKTNASPLRYGVKKYNSAGTYLTRTGNSVNQSNPRGIAVDGTNVYVAEKGISEITSFPIDLSGNGVEHIAGLNQVEGISVNNGTLQYVSDTANNRVLIYGMQPAGLSLSGIAFIDGNLTINSEVLYTVGALGGTIAVTGDINIAATGQNFFSPAYPVDDPDIANFRLVNCIGLITEDNITINGSGGGDYQNPEIVALMYGKNSITIGSPINVRGMFASNQLILEQVPWIYLQKPEIMPPFMPGSDPQIYIGGWKEPE